MTLDQKVRVAIYEGPGTTVRPLERALRGFGFQVRKVSVEAPGSLDDCEVDVIYLPGGGYRLNSIVKDYIRDFVGRGGGCVGSCWGSYLVAGDLGLIPGRAVLSNVRGRLYLEPRQGDHDILEGVARRCLRHDQRKWEPVAVTHLGGPFLFPENRESIVASYDIAGEVGALVAAEADGGRAVAIASHPELPLAALPAADYSHLKKAVLPQGDAIGIIRNAVLWAAGRRDTE